jgi:hypothetical protein
MSRDESRDARQVSGVTTDRPQVKYPFEFDGRWVLRYHVPYTVEHDGATHRILATIFADPSVHGRIQINRDGQFIAEYDELVPGSTVEITGDEWRVTEVEYRTHVALQRVPGVTKEETGAQGE